MRIHHCFKMWARLNGEQSSKWFVGVFFFNKENGYSNLAVLLMVKYLLEIKFKNKNTCICYGLSKSIMKQSKTSDGGISISIPVNPVSVSVLTLEFYLCITHPPYTALNHFNIKILFHAVCSSALAGT